MSTRCVDLHVWHRVAKNEYESTSHTKWIEQIIIHTLWHVTILKYLQDGWTCLGLNGLRELRSLDACGHKLWSVAGVSVQMCYLLLKTGQVAMVIKRFSLSRLVTIISLAPEQLVNPSKTKV